LNHYLSDRSNQEFLFTQINTNTDTNTNTNTDTNTNPITDTKITSVTNIMAGYNGYPLDSHREINMLSLTWNDSFSSISLTKQELSLEECLQAVEDVLTVLESTTTKGFLPGYDLTTFPIVSEILPALIKGKGTQYLRGEKSMESYK